MKFENGGGKSRKRISSSLSYRRSWDLKDYLRSTLGSCHRQDLAQYLQGRQVTYEVSIRLEEQDDTIDSCGLICIGYSKKCIQEERTLKQ